MDDLSCERDDVLGYPDDTYVVEIEGDGCTTGCSSGLADIEALGEKYSIDLDKSLLNKFIVDLMGKVDTIRTKDELHKFLTIERRKYKKQFSFPQLLYGYRLYCVSNGLAVDQRIVTLLQKKTLRSQSGVMVVTVFTSPYPDGQKFSCEYDCYYCPNEPGQPRSYLMKEPGVLRANRFDFDCVKQFRDRCKTYHDLGHPVDKIEVIVLGGTWSSYPKEYQDQFISDIYYAANTYSSKPVALHRDKLSLEEEMKINQDAQCHIVGLGLETRPDRINGRELREFRRYGVTKVLMGVQSVFDKYLIRVNRRCNVSHAIKAIKLLKNACFKVQCHIMFDLPQPLRDGVNPHKSVFEFDDIDWSVNVSDDDRKMIDILVSDPRFSFDEIKIYPTMTTEYTRIKDEYERGVYKPYGEEKEGIDQMFENIMYLMERLPPYVRDDRTIRDIPVKDYVVAGTKRGNMGQDIYAALQKRGIKCMAIRYREIRKQDIDPSTAVLVQRIYDGSDGKEHFLSFETPDERNIFGFLRLRLSEDAGKGNSGTIEFPELVGCAMIRELHIYGQTVAVSSSSEKGDDMPVKSTQHAGLGTQLMIEALRIAQEHNYKKISVISGIGVMNYYRRFGFEIEGENNYMIKHFV